MVINEEDSILVGIIFLLEYNSDILKIMVQYQEWRLWHSLAYNKFYIWVLSAHIFNVLLFKLFCVWYGKKADIKKKSTLQIGIFNAMKGKKNAKVHLIKIMKGPVKIFQDQGAAVSKVQFQRFFIFKEQIVSLNLS